LKKRREHGLQSWVMFLDLVKAFDRVYTSGDAVECAAKIRCAYKTGADFAIIEYQCVLGPILFIFYISGIMTTWRAVHDRPLCSFKTKNDSVMSERRYTARGESFELSGRLGVR
jgi:hypothetical protein